MVGLKDKQLFKMVLMENVKSVKNALIFWLNNMLMKYQIVLLEIYVMEEYFVLVEYQ